MNIATELDILIDSPADKVWSVLWNEFGEIEKWCSGIRKSHAVFDNTSNVEKEVCGRVCDALPEKLTHYNLESFTFTYVGENTPWFIRNIGNTWIVSPSTQSSSVVKMKPVIELNMFFGFIALTFKPLLNKFGRRVLEDLKYYMENGTPHPRKLKEREREIK